MFVPGTPIDPPRRCYGLGVFAASAPAKWSMGGADAAEGSDIRATRSGAAAPQPLAQHPRGLSARRHHDIAHAAFMTPSADPGRWCRAWGISPQPKIMDISDAPWPRRLVGGDGLPTPGMRRR